MTVFQYHRLVSRKLQAAIAPTNAFSIFAPTWRRLLILIGVVLVCIAWITLPLDFTASTPDVIAGIAEECVRPLPPWIPPERHPDEIHILTSMWDSLTDLFAANPPHPARMIRPVLSRPPNDKVSDFTADLADAYLSMSDSKAKATRDAHQRVVENLPPYHAVSSSFRGRGLVILAGGRFSGYASTSLGVLRQLGSELPVEIWIKDESEEDEAWSQEIRRQGAVLRRLSDYAAVTSVYSWLNPFAWWSKSVPWSPYQMKAMAIMFSSFEEVLYLDADCAPLQDPALLFSSQEYLQHGAIIWPDFWPSIASRWLPYLIGLTDEKSDMLWHQHTAESGQMVIHKAKHWKSLLLAAYYNFHGPAFWYTAITGNGPGWGDKDTYLFALQALKEPFETIPTLPHGLRASNATRDILTLQFSPTLTSEAHPNGHRSPFFMHSCGGIKWGLDDFIEAYSASPTMVWIKSLISPRYRLAHDLLRSGSRMLERDLQWPDLDPEYMLWMALEDTACWKDRQSSSCIWTRERIQSILGISTFKNDSHGC